MSGPDGIHDERGITMRVASLLFERARRHINLSLSFRLSILEIYNESVIDLLVEPTPSFNSITPATQEKLSIVDSIGK